MVDYMFHLVSVILALFFLPSYAPVPVVHGGFFEAQPVKLLWDETQIFVSDVRIKCNFH